MIVTSTGLSSSALHIDAKWGHFGTDYWVEGRPTEEGQGAALGLSAARRKAATTSNPGHRAWPQPQGG